MNYYQLLDVPHNATTDEIKSHYRKYAKKYHPDKGGDEEQFKLIQEAYETLMDPIKRHEYDIELSGNSYIFTKQDYDTILKYYNSLIQSVEVRFMMTLFYGIPKNIRSQINIFQLFQTQSKSTQLITIHSIKYIDATQLFDNITLHLKRCLQDVFNRVVKQIIIKTRQGYYSLFITDSDYDIYLFNSRCSTLKLELSTTPTSLFTKRGYDLIYIKHLDLYEYYYGAVFQLTLPNKFRICCRAKDLRHKKQSIIDTFGFYNPYTRKRGNLCIVYQLVHTEIDTKETKETKEILKRLFHKKEIFIDPSLPIYQV